MDNFSKRFLQSCVVGFAMVAARTEEVFEDKATVREVITIEIEVIRQKLDEVMASCGQVEEKTRKDLLLFEMNRFIDEDGGEESFADFSEAKIQAVAYQERMAQRLMSKMGDCVVSIEFVSESNGNAIMVKFAGSDNYEKLGSILWTMENNDGNYSLHGAFEGIDSRSRVFEKNIEIRQLEPEPIDDYGQFYNG